MLPSAFYLGAWAVELRPRLSLGQSLEPAGPRPGETPRSVGRPVFSLSSMLLALALLSHVVALYLQISVASGVRFGFAHILSSAVWFGALMLWVEGDNDHVSAMRALVLPVAAILAPLPLLFQGALFTALAERPLFVPHMMVGTLAYSVLFLAALHALLMTAAERALHAREPADDSLSGRFLNRLPPLLSLDRILFRLVGVGFVLLTLTVVSGVLFSEEIFGRAFQFDHKTLFALLAWGLFGVLVVGRLMWGWRGRLAARFTLSGFVAVLLAYAGSRFVLEVIVARPWV